MTSAGINNIEPSRIIAMPDKARVAFSEMELYGNWGSHGWVFADGALLNDSEFGRLPYNDLQADSAFRRKEISVGAFVTNIVLEVDDITSSSEIFIDDFIVYGPSTNYPAILTPPRGGSESSCHGRCAKGCSLRLAPSVCTAGLRAGSRKNLPPDARRRIVPDLQY